MRALLFWVLGLPLLWPKMAWPAPFSAEAPVPLLAPSRWQESRWPTTPGAEDLPVLHRGALLPPLRYRVLVLPGSGCAGMGAIAPRYFAGLLHAEVWVLHKPGTHVGRMTPPAQCPAAFIQIDALAWWHRQAQAGLEGWWQRTAHDPAAMLPTVLVGISEGAELVPALAPVVPGMAAMVLLSAPGLDPHETAVLQAQRLGRWPEWQALERAQASLLPDHTIYQGRSLRYWRDLWHWPLEQPLRSSPWPLLQVWGDADALVPAQAFALWAQRMQQRPALWCVRQLPSADHGLQHGAQDGVQQLWHWLEQWARQPLAGLCAPTTAAPSW